MGKILVRYWQDLAHILLIYDWYCSAWFIYCFCMGNRGYNYLKKFLHYKFFSILVWGEEVIKTMDFSHFFESLNLEREPQAAPSWSFWSTWFNQLICSTWYDQPTAAFSMHHKFSPSFSQSSVLKRTHVVIARYWDISRLFYELVNKQVQWKLN